ncbi:MAG: hypothetical protein MHMPM18_004634 [Marteilia pararefringens]
MACVKSLKLAYRKCKKKIKVIGPLICWPLKIKAICKLTRKLKGIVKLDCKKMATRHSLNSKFANTQSDMEEMQSAVENLNLQILPVESDSSDMNLRTKSRYTDKTSGKQKSLIISEYQFYMKLGIR